MFLLGHSVWGYLFCRLTGRRIHSDIPLSIALLAGLIPDLDLVFGPVGLVHGTYTHSLLFLVPLAVLITILFRKRGFIVALGILSHLLTDGLVGTIPILFPFSSIEVGLGLPLGIDAILEVGVLFVVIIYMFENGDAWSILKGNTRNIWLIFPLVIIVSLSLLVIVDYNIYLPAYAFSRKALTFITLGHYLLGFVMSLAIVLSFKTLVSNMLRSRREQV